MKYIKQSFLSLILSFLLVFSVSTAFSWVGPTAEPPNNNAPAPINVSNTTQSKSGSLSIGTTASPGAKFTANTYVVNEKSIEATANDAQKIFMVPWLDTGGFNPITSSGDKGIFWTTNDATYGNDNSTGALVIGPWGTSGGIKINKNGSLRISDGTQGAGKVLTSDASGNTSWQSGGGGGGGSGTVSGEITADNAGGARTEVPIPGEWDVCFITNIYYEQQDSTTSHGQRDGNQCYIYQLGTNSFGVAAFQFGGDGGRTICSAKCVNF